MLRSGLSTLLLVLLLTGFANAQDPYFQAEFLFELREDHNHAPAIVELPSGDMYATWYRGAGERTADNVVVLGALKKKGESEWGEDYQVADFPGFPDCNTAMIVDPKGNLWLFWPTIIANTWESALTNFMVTNQFSEDGKPEWGRHGVMFLKPDDFEKELIEKTDELLLSREEPLTERQSNYFAEIRERAGDKLYQRLGWMPRCKPTILPSGRMILPLYTDTYSISLMAISDNGGISWRASKPLFGFGNIQPTVLRKNDGTLVAYQRDNGFEKKIKVSVSEDDGETWSDSVASDMPNPSAGIDAVRLSNGHWAMIHNDVGKGRHKLAVSISDDEGQTWKWTRRLEDQESGSYHYPAIMQSNDGRLHAIYSYFTKKEGGKEGKTMKHAEFDEEWVLAGDKE
ncbi:hypothetical protein Pla110_30630 [Polystyrenella longa]|uniref:Sialidase domain-containing protein n=1 Tax=Polystyrenella longa TaxID=2528007 RepID=A0A518CQ07_9PLAN|nr:sialidase family protein [Polystyrenella longa]QDU81322.1 hypothetical protein Pla110_30630 [Polystyrenella longa]